MGMVGVYMMADSRTLDRLLELDDEDLVDELDELESEDEVEVYSIDKLWDGLHFLLTGASATSPIEGNKLSEAIVGIHVFDLDDDDIFVAYTKFEEVPDIVKAMDCVDVSKLKTQFATKDYCENNIYPDIWFDDRADELLGELIAEYSGLLSFYRQAVAQKKHVLFSVL